jgi:dihydroorotate dehydrogenase electron transfer subunit
MQHYQLEIADRRAATTRLTWLTLHAPDLARNIRPGQYLLLRCTETGSYDPLLRRPLFVAAALEPLGQVALLFEPNERGLAWLARGRPGEIVDAVGPFGQPFAIDRRTRALLLLGQGPGLAALLLLAQQAVTRGCSVTLLASADDVDALPPPFLLPGDVEYHTGLQFVDRNAPAARPEARAPDTRLQTAIQWADQLCAALPPRLLPQLRDAVRAARLRWDRGFASVLRESPLVCGVGACGVCAVATRHGQRMACSDGPVFELREIADAT